ncbi:exodeoxyribonuclease V subunit alpha [Undibacterium sp. SXout11W]|uniref:exodeoxyribonuclease V subunit alpha n=1 Tax=Undibacterium sp. SXout11W TaxID=3413050 RepID=UPI003BF28D3F
MKTAADLLTELNLLVDQAQLRHLAVAFVRFMMDRGMQDPARLFCAVVLTEIEARGHICLDLDSFAQDPYAVLEWDATIWNKISGDFNFPKSSEGWIAALNSSEHIYVAEHDAHQRQHEQANDLFSHLSNDDQQQALVLQGHRLYLRRYWKDENIVAQAIRARADNCVDVAEDDVRRWLDILFDTSFAVQNSAANTETDWQKVACAIAVRRRLSIITGGPGTGKTYTVARLIALMFALNERPERLRVALAAPTGKAAARLKQSIDNALQELARKLGNSLPLQELTLRMGAARTLHSLLGARPDTRHFRHHAGNPLDVDILVVDEASMIHLEMMASLLDALPANTILVLLGDKDQLASVEAGAVLGDLCGNAEAGGYSDPSIAYIQRTAGQFIAPEFYGHAGVISQQTVMLRKSRRFNGPIGALANAVNDGDADAANTCLRTSGPILHWIDHAKPAQLINLALEGRAGTEGGYKAYLELLKNCPVQATTQSQDQQSDLEHKFKEWVIAVLRAFDTFRILCAVKEGDWGVNNLNVAIEQSLHGQGLIKRDSEWYAGRPVMVTRNDYNAGVFNGDIGLALPDVDPDKSIRVYFLDGDNLRSILASRLRYVETAYAMTVHKSQGSEFAHTVLVLPQDMSPVLTRELVYTGITRARTHFTLVSPVNQIWKNALSVRTLRASGLMVALHSE